jgi:hypothetical protein
MLPLSNPRYEASSKAYEMSDVHGAKPHGRGAMNRDHTGNSCRKASCAQTCGCEYDKRGCVRREAQAEII